MKNKYKIIIFALMIIAFIVFSILWPNYYRRKVASDCSLCVRNIEKIASEIKKFKNNTGKYPQSLDQLNSENGFIIPVCKTANKDTYTESYIVDNNNAMFTLYCKGHFHKEVGLDKNSPLYSSKFEKIFYSTISIGHAEQLEINKVNLCKDNLNNIVQGLNKYYSQKNKYPDELKDIVPIHINSIPSCPKAKKDTYSESYIVNTNKSVFTIYCKGHVHKNAGADENFPLTGSLLDDVYINREELDKAE